MNLNLYDEDLNRIAIIGSQYISCLWSEGYNTVENFSLELNATDEYKKKIRPDCYIGRNDRKTLMVIKSVVIRDKKIVASGKQAARVLDDVVFVGTIKSGKKLTSSIRNAYVDSSQYRNTEFSDIDLEIKYNRDISNKTILELCKIMCQDTDVGFRAINRNSKLVVEFYQPELNPNLVFAEKYGNLSVKEIALSKEPLKNYCVVLGMATENGRIRVDVDATNGADKRELIIDARDLQKEETETEESYMERLAVRGYEKLLEYQQTFTTAFTPFAKDFATKYDLGDILTVHLPDYGIKLQARVTRFTQKSQNNRTETTVDVGQITLQRR